MIGQSLAHMDIAALQKAVLGMNPAIKPYAALAALQEKVKSEQMKQGQAMQNPAQPPVAEQMMAQAQQLSPAQINNPYMASGLGAAPVQSPVQAPTANMASGGIIAFDHGGEVPRFDGKTGSRVMATPEPFDNSIAGLDTGSLYAQAIAKYKAGQPLNVREQAIIQQVAPSAGANMAPPSILPGRNIDNPEAVNNTIEGMQTGTPYADAMNKIKADTDARANAPMSGQGKALTYLSAPLAAAGDLLASPINAARKYSFRNPMDQDASPSMTPLLDARERALAGDMGNKELTEMRDTESAKSAKKSLGMEDEINRRMRELEKTAKKELTPAGKEMFRQKEIAKILAEQKNSGSVKLSELGAPVAGATPEAANLSKTSATNATGATKRTPANVGGGAGRADAGGINPYAGAGLGLTGQADRYDVTPQYKTMEEFTAARKAAETSAGKLPEDEYSATLRANRETRKGNLEKVEKTNDQMAALSAAGHFFGPGNLLQNANKGILAYAEAKIKGNSALEAAKEKSLDADDAWARYNQAREDGNKKDARDAFKDFNIYSNDAKRLNLTGIQLADTAEHFRRADATGARMADAAMLAAKNRGIMGGYGADKQQLNELKALQTSLKDQLKDPMLGLPRNAAQKSALVRQLEQVNGAIASMAGLNTMPQATPSPGAGGTNLPPIESFYTTR
jgi:hypothetical protein